MNQVLRMSQLYAPTLKEVPSDAAIASHRLLLRAGFMRKSATGLYSFLPLGWRVVRKIEAIVREEMDALGAQEIMMPMLQPAELWRETGRWDDYGPEMMTLSDRHGVELCLGPTHEELVTDLVRNELRSYKQLPVVLYQTQSKYRDEIRPRFGLMRSREFIMKDAYSFDADEEGMQKNYDAMYDAYARICERIGLDYRPVDADGGQIGKGKTCEFHALADAGEAELATCTCGWAANTEVAHALAHPLPTEARELTKIATPGVHTIAALAEFLGCPEAATVKAMVGKDAEGNLVALFIPGDHELGELKAERAVPGFTLATDEEMEAAGLPKGSIGCVGLPEGIRVGADESLRDVPAWGIGANVDGYHYVGAAPGRDFQVDFWADLVEAREGDACPVCGGPVSLCRGIEVSQVFQLGTKYSEALHATFLDENGVERPYVMGCYGVGVTRSMAAVVEQRNDEHGIMWPASVAPAHVCVLPLQMKDAAVAQTAERIACDLAALGVEVVVDDRDERPGVKFADADLIGWPLQVVVGKRGLEAGVVELKCRRTGEKREMPLDELRGAQEDAARAADPVASFLHAVAGIDFPQAATGR